MSDPGLEYLEALRARFELAAEPGGALEDELEMAGLRLRLRFAGAATREALLPPLEHLAVEAAPAPELTICVFDTASTGVGPPALPWRPPRAEPGTTPFARYESGRSCVLVATGPGTATITGCDLDEGLAIFHMDDVAAMPANERAAPLREALHLLMGRRGRWVTHAGAVGRDGRGALLAGTSGSGKSTLALSCALAGMELVADDHVLLEVGPPIVAHGMHSTVKLTPPSAELIGVGSRIVGADFLETIEGPSKAEVGAERIAPGSLRRRLEVTALIAPSVAGLERPRLKAISPGAGLRSLAPSTLIQLHSRGSSALPALAALAREVPSYALELSTDPEANAAAVARVVDGGA